MKAVIEREGHDQGARAILHRQRRTMPAHRRCSDAKLVPGVCNAKQAVRSRLQHISNLHRLTVRLHPSVDQSLSESGIIQRCEIEAVFDLFIDLPIHENSVWFVVFLNEDSILCGSNVIDQF